MLARIRKSMEEKDQGFTLIELLVVIIIIGILAAIAIPVFLNQRKKATEASMKSDLRTAANEFETYFTDNQVYPAAVPASVKTSPGNALAIQSGQAAGTFCVRVTNTNLGTDFFVYDSDAGGVLGKNVACIAAP
jgi:type II secretion system protein G